MLLAPLGPLHAPLVPPSGSADAPAPAATGTNTASAPAVAGMCSAVAGPHDHAGSAALGGTVSEEEGEVIEESYEPASSPVRSVAHLRGMPP